jgi:hypothetical protein
MSGIYLYVQTPPIERSFSHVVDYGSRKTRYLFHGGHSGVLRGLPISESSMCKAPFESMPSGAVARTDRSHPRRAVAANPRHREVANRDPTQSRG